MIQQMLQCVRRITLLVGIAVIIALSSRVNAATPAQFGLATNFFTGGAIAGPIAVADFNQNGKPDVAVLRNSGVSVLLGLGNGALTPSSNYPVSTANAALAVGDFNRDRNLDLAVAASYSMHILLGNGAGGFSVSTNLDSHLAYPSAITVGDFNGDGKPDLAASINNVSVGIFFGHGDGYFTARTNYAIMNGSGDIRAVDLDGNGRLDLVVCINSYSSANSNALCILANRGDGTFAAPQYLTTVGGANQKHPSLEFGDFNCDGNLDMAVLNSSVSRNGNSVTIWTNGGSGIPTPAQQYALEYSPTGLAKEDFNGDGKVDLLIRGGSAANVLLGNGDTSFSVSPRMDMESDSNLYRTLAVGDFDGNATPDLAFADYSANSVGIMLNQTPPVLQLTPMTGYNQINWSSRFGSGFMLECTTNLAEQGSWRPFPHPPVLIGIQNAVSDWADGPQRFYRLIKPLP